MKLLKFGLFVGLFVGLIVSSAGAHAVSCSETVKTLIVDKNGTVHFTTNLSCSQSWCKLNWSDSEAVKKAYSLLLTAHTTGAKVKFNWSTITSCGQNNSAGSSPEYMYLEEPGS